MDYLDYKMKRTFIGAALIAVTALSACAKKPENISASYISPLQYQKYSCSQIRQEAGRLSTRLAEVTGVQSKKAEGDAVATGVALVLFWPAAFFIKGDKETATELARLKGEMETLEKVSIEKRCRIEFRKAPLEEVEEAET